MSLPWLVAAICLYLSSGFLIAGLSMRVWDRAESDSIPARVLFPWNAHDRCVGADAGFSVYGELHRHRFAPVPVYVTLLALFWPLKLVWCVCTWTYVNSRYYHH